MRTEQDEIYALLDKYNAAIEPVESWETADVVKLINLLDAELQRRHAHDAGFITALQEVEPEDFDVWGDDDV